MPSCIFFDRLLTVCRRRGQSVNRERPKAAGPLNFDSSSHAIMTVLKGCVRRIAKSNYLAVERKQVLINEKDLV